jgi:phosphoglycolate phosphatase
MKPIYDMILFDLDGTLSDPITGIARSINYALAAFGYDELPQGSLAKFIGPPIDDTFALLAETNSETHIKDLIDKYRECFSEVGYSENVLYPGVLETLTELHESGVAMAVCTSKRADYAEKILALFQLDSLFRFVSGGGIGIHKGQQIERLLTDGKITHNTLMIGDRCFDLVAAHSNGIDSAGVLWGYGTREELESENPSRLFNSPGEWISLMGQAGR